jgi:hypothetical protein
VLAVLDLARGERGTARVLRFQFLGQPGLE